MKIGDRVMRRTTDYGVMVGTVVEIGSDNKGRARLRIKWDGGVRTWNLATVLHPLDQAGYIALTEQAIEWSRQYMVKNRYDKADIERNAASSAERYAKEAARLFGDAS